MLFRRYRLEFFLCNVTVRNPPPPPLFKGERLELLKNHRIGGIKIFL